MEVKTDKFVDTSRETLADPISRNFLNFLPVALSAMRQAGLSNLPDPAGAQKQTGVIRAESLSRLPELLEQFEEKATAAGATVFWARDGQAANEYILNLAVQNDIGYVTKGKSMVTEEAGLNEMLEGKGIDVFETDLGEFITQLLKRPPFHILGPAINVPADQIRDLFMEKIGLEEPTSDPAELGYAARLFLREKFHHMQMGITGVNLAVAETGTIINAENEGNIRMNKSSPRIQVSVMTLEKIVATMSDALLMLRLLCRNATGQDLGAYISMDTGPKKSDEIDGPEELHIIILDNGRSKLYQEPVLREILRCLRCGACINICPVFCRIGGYPYGWAYTGPMGQILNPLLLGLAETHDLIHACTMCGACKDVCFTGVDHPHLLRLLRNREATGDADLGAVAPPLKDVWALKLFGQIAASPTLWRAMIKLLRPLLNRDVRDNQMTKGLGPLSIWLQDRSFPEMPAQTFRERWATLKAGMEREGN